MSKECENKNEPKYVTTKKAKEMLGVSMGTLHNWEKSEKIETIRTAGNHRLYNVDKYISENKEIKENEKNKCKINVCYIRVSTIGQKDDLLRQKKYMLKKYPNYLIIEDIGSGINFNRRGLKKIIKMAINGEIETLVVAYKDRLTRFGFEMIEDLIKTYSKGKIVVENEKEIKEPKEELVDDVLQILNIYTAKLNGLRKYGNKL